MANAASQSTQMLLQRLEKVKQNGHGWTACCPAHKDKSPSLAITEKDGKTLVHCFAGCYPEDVLAAVDMTWADLFEESITERSRVRYQLKAAQQLAHNAGLLYKVALADASKKTSDDEELSDDLIKELGEYQKAKDEAEKALQSAMAKAAELESADENANPLAKRLSFDSDAELDRIASQQWLIDSVIPMDSFGMLFGPSGSYKSFCAVDMAAAIASGQAWAGHTADNPGYVIYIGAEGAAGLHMRKRAWEIRHQKKLSKLGILSAAVSIASIEERRNLIDLLEQLTEEVTQPPRLIVIDTLARSYNGDENSASDMGNFVRACDIIRVQSGASILIIHHAGKDADKGARGSSALRAAVDYEIKVTSPAKLNVTIECTKAKDVEPFEQKTIKLSKVEIGKKDAKGRDMVSLVLDGDPAGSGSSIRQDSPSSDEPVGALTISDIIARAIVNGGGSTTYQFARDEYFHLIGRPKTDSTAKMQFKRGFEWLESNGRILRRPDGVVTLPERF